MKSKGERERYIQLNAEFQRIPRRDKKDFFNEQCSIMEENNKRGNIRDLLRKTGNIKGAFHPNMDTINDEKCRDLVDAEKIKKIWKECMEELSKEDLNEPDYCNGMVSHPEPDILECEVKWSLKSTAVNKAS